MKVALVAYKHTGKDTLFKILNKEINNYEKWQVYSNTQNRLPNFGFGDLINNKYKRIALADKLKEKICKIHSIKYVEEEKDVKNILVNNELFSFRDLCIDYAINNDPLIWVKKVAKILEENKNENYMVTDLRLLHELEILEKLDNYVSIRLFDGLKEIPCKNIKSEHELDFYSTDFLLLRNVTFENFLILFPQYLNYENINSL